MTTQHTHMDLVVSLRTLIPRGYRTCKWSLKPQTHQGANDSQYPDFNVWVRGTEWTKTTFFIGDLCLWDLEREGWRLMVWSPE